MQSLDTNFKNIKIVIFDLDGTIANTNKLILETFQKILKKNIKDIKKEMGPPSKIMIKNIFKINNMKKINAYNDVWEREYKKNICKNNFLIKDTIKTLKYLKSKYVIGIITSSTKKIALLTLKENFNLFDFILCSEDLEKPKPDPKILNDIIRINKLNDSELVYVGDNILDIKFGKNAKIKTIGKVDLLYSKKDLEKEKPDFIIKKISDLKCIL